MSTFQPTLNNLTSGLDALGSKATSTEGISLYSFLASLTVAAVIFAVQFILFLLIKSFLLRVYQPKTYLVPESERVDAPPPGLISWLYPLFRTPESEFLAKCGLDAYFFLRYLRTLLTMFACLAVAVLPILLPLNAIGGRGSGFARGTNRPYANVTGLDQLSFGNVRPDRTSRYWAHLVLAIVVVLLVCFVFFVEFRNFVRTRQEYLCTFQHRIRASATTVLITGIPDSLMSEKRLSALYSMFPGGVRQVWLNRDLEALYAKVQLRNKLALKLEEGETALIRRAMKAYQREVELEQKRAGRKVTKDEKRAMQLQSDVAAAEMAQGGGVSAGEPKHDEPGRSAGNYFRARMPVAAVGNGMEAFGAEVSRLGQAMRQRLGRLGRADQPDSARGSVPEPGWNGVSFQGGSSRAAGIAEESPSPTTEAPAQLPAAELEATHPPQHLGGELRAAAQAKADESQSPVAELPAPAQAVADASQPSPPEVSAAEYAPRERQQVHARSSGEAPEISVAERLAHKNGVAEDTSRPEAMHIRSASQENAWPPSSKANGYERAKDGQVMDKIEFEKPGREQPEDEVSDNDDPGTSGSDDRDIDIVNEDEDGDEDDDPRLIELRKRTTEEVGRFVQRRMTATQLPRWVWPFANDRKSLAPQPPPRKYPIAYRFRAETKRYGKPLWKKYLTYEDREAMYVVPLEKWWLPHLPLFSTKVDKIYYCRRMVAQLNLEIEMDQQHPETFPLLNSAFVQFNNQMAAHMACQTVAHHMPQTMAPRILEITPSEVIWKNLAVKWSGRYVRTTLVTVLIIGLIVGWAFPVTFTGLLSQVRSLTSLLPWLGWLLRLPAWALSLVQGVLPQLLLQICLAFVPSIIRALTKLQSLATASAVEMSVQTYYFIFLFIQIFLVVSISSGVTSAIKQLIQSVGSAPAILAVNLPRASNYFFSYLLLQAFSVSAGALAQIGSLFNWFALAPILDKTARQKWSRQTTLPQVQWGSLFPVYTNLAAIGIIYSIISPLVLVFCFVTFCLFWVTFRYNTLYVTRFHNDTGGLLYPRAINQLFTGVYVMELCMIGLFFLVRDTQDRVACRWQGIVMIVVFFITVAYQVLLNRAYGPLLKYIPLTAKDIVTDEETRRMSLLQETKLKLFEKEDTPSQEQDDQDVRKQPEMVKELAERRQPGLRRTPSGSGLSQHEASGEQRAALQAPLDDEKIVADQTMPNQAADDYVVVDGADLDGACYAGTARDQSVPQATGNHIASHRTVLDQAATDDAASGRTVAGRVEQGQAAPQAVARDQIIPGTDAVGDHAIVCRTMPYQARCDDETAEDMAPDPAAPAHDAPNADAPREPDVAVAEQQAPEAAAAAGDEKAPATDKASSLLVAPRQRGFFERWFDVLARPIYEYAPHYRRHSRRHSLRPSLESLGIRHDAESLRAEGIGGGGGRLGLFTGMHDHLEDLDEGMREMLLRRAFEHEALRAKRPVVWLPRDELGISDDEIFRMQACSKHIWASNAHASIDQRGRVMYSRSPPDFSDVDLVRL